MPKPSAGSSSSSSPAPTCSLCARGSSLRLVPPDALAEDEDALPRMPARWLRWTAALLLLITVVPALAALLWR